MPRRNSLPIAPVILLVALISACGAGEEALPESSENAAAPEAPEEGTEAAEEPEEGGAGGPEAQVEAGVGDTVKVHYTGTLPDGTVFDTSRDGEPLEFTIGSGQLIAGFEQPVIGMKVGESTNVTVPPEEGYGPHREELVFEVARDELPSESEPSVGQVYTAMGSQGTVRARVVDVSEDAVTLDANHPLAGKTLMFEIELVEIVEDVEATGE
jgi:peptidylprolyl isomerase